MGAPAWTEEEPGRVRIDFRLRSDSAETVGLDLDRPPFNPELVQTIDELAKNDTPSAHVKIYQALLRSELIVPAWNNPPKRPGDLAEPFWMRTPDGVVLPVFTDWQAVALWPMRQQPKSFLILRGQGALCRAAQSDASTRTHGRDRADCSQSIQVDSALG